MWLISLIHALTGLVTSLTYVVWAPGQSQSITRFLFSLWRYLTCYLTTILLDVDVNAVEIQSQWTLNTTIPVRLPVSRCDLELVKPTVRDCCVGASFRDFCCLFCLVFFWGHREHILLHSAALLMPSFLLPPKTHRPSHPLLGMSVVSCTQEERRAAKTIEKHCNCSQEP